MVHVGISGENTEFELGTFPNCCCRVWMFLKSFIGEIVQANNIFMVERLEYLCLTPKSFFQLFKEPDVGTSSTSLGCIPQHHWDVYPQHHWDVYPPEHVLSAPGVVMWSLRVEGE